MRFQKEIRFGLIGDKFIDPWYKGYNGTVPCHGVEITNAVIGDKKLGVIITPMNRRGVTPSTWIEIPHKAVPELIEILQEIVRGDEDVSEGHS